MSEKELIRQTANNLRVKIEYIKAISQAYDSISRFAGYSIEQVNRLVVEERVGKVNNYYNLPIDLKNRVVEIIRKTGDVGKHFNPFKKPRNFEAFAKKFLADRQQPKDYVFLGVLTYKELKFDIGEDKTYDVEIHNYQGKG